MKSVTGLRSPLRWSGGQSRVAKDIVNCVPKHSAYVEPCCGAAWVFWAKPKELSRAEVLNDLDGELINFYRTLHRRGRRLTQEVDSIPYSRRLFRQVAHSKPRTAFARAVQFGDGDHVRLREVLRRTAGCWLLSYRNCAQVRRLYKGCHRKLVSTRYTLGCNSAARARSEARELLLSNRPLLRRGRA